MKCFKEAVVNRRSVYSLGKNISMLEEEILGAVGRMVKETPSPFNIQSARVIVAMNEHHENVWNITEDVLKNIVSIAQYKETEKKLEGFKAAYGTILFFEDESIIRSLQAQYPLYAENFPLWAQQSNGMLQYMIWAALSEHDIGASLQHYTPLIDDAVREEYTVSADWKLVAQMPFGSIAAPAGDKTFQPLDERVKVFD